MPSAGDAQPGELAIFERFCLGLTLDDGKPFQLEPFQLTMLSDYFGGVVETLILLPKKNGKTTLLASLALFHLVTTPEAECVIGATSRDQATILYEQATGFVTRSASLQKRVKVQSGYRRIQSKSDGGRVRVLAADVDTADGIIPTLALVDELHRAKSGGLYGVFRDGLGPRDGQMLTISTAGDHERSVLGQMRAAARKLPGLKHEGKYLYVKTSDDAFAMHEWALERDDDVSDLALVKLVNPLSTQTIEKLAQRHSSPSMLPATWARFACGIWMSGDSWWIAPEDWDDQVDDAQLEDGDTISIGFDGSRYNDATALVACRLSDGLLQPLGVWSKPEGEKEWEVPSGAVDAALADAMERYRVVRGYFDPPLWQTEIDGWAREFGDQLVTRYPTNRSRFMAAVERFRTDVVSGELHHVGDETLSQHVLSAQMRETRGGYWLEKQTGEYIDAAIAAVLAYEARCDAVGIESDRSEYAFL